MATLKVIFTVFEALFALNLLIFVHELGHFLAARWRGMKVERFAIWFGKPIWKTKINGVEYALGWIPAGGYVSLPQMATMEVIEGKTEDSEKPLPPAPPLDKIIVAFAGPLFSFLLAIAFAVVVWGVGKPVNALEGSTTVGWVVPDGPAWKAGLRPGDKITEVDGRPVTQFGPPSQDSVTWRIVTSEGTNIAIKYIRDGQENITLVTPTKLATKWYERKSLRKVLIAPMQPAIIYEIATNSPADVALLQKGDEIMAVDGEKIYSFEAVNEAVRKMTNGAITPVTLSVRRNSEQFDRIVTPEKPLQPTNSGPALGIISWQLNTNVTLAHPGPVQQIRESAGQIFATIRTVFSPKSDIGVQQLGGAVMIIRVYKNLFDSEYGWRLVLWFSVLLNVNLAMLNLLPLPVLDGGHILLSLIEAARRRPVSPRFLNYIQSGFAVLLIGFMLFIAFFDTGDWIRSARDDRESAIVFAPKQ